MSTKQNNPITGRTYRLNHYRFGRATVQVLKVDGEWAECLIISGTLRGMGYGAVWRPGDTKSVRIEHGVWQEQE